MSTDVEPAGTEPVVAAGTEVAHITTFEEAVQEQLQAERSLWKTVGIGVLIATPICIGIWMAMVAISVGGKSAVSWGLWLAMGAVIGLLAGAFFGGLFAFITNSHLLDEADRHTAAAKHELVLGHY